ncbi:hypothetical protein [Vibrio parahaemolyticus]|uniref:hypothetical protein n=1 Tax=Vibrio parahaemolyticus TaxID=670 RepID=UPI0004E78BCF|nr:hypothetical protein [Vibrio parahaemolyticus]KFE96068.1 hypothetical protein HB39_04755 [Vibrio parahaemolyticus]MBX5339525.1 hypothetical protein [Vibrio parahaemolyticus]
MKLCRCPICHSNLHLDALISDDAGRELLAAVAKMPDFIARPMMSYITLFRPLKSDLSNSRALRLIEEVLAEHKADHLLASALIECTTKLREKRVLMGDEKPLANHNYLKSVYKTLAVKNNVAVAASPKAQAEPVQPDNSAWYIQRANQMLAQGKDPLAETSPIAAKLRELGWVNK